MAFSYSHTKVPKLPHVDYANMYSDIKPKSANNNLGQMNRSDYSPIKD